MKPPSGERAQGGAVQGSGAQGKPNVVQAGSVVEQIEEDEIAHCYWAPIPEPKTREEALNGPNGEKWKASEDEEFGSLIENETWDLCDLPPGKKAITSKMIYRHKYGPEGELIRYKSRLVARGFQQTKGKDYDEVFAPVGKGTTLRVLLAIAALLGWKIRQMDIVTAFLNGIIMEEVYMKQPEGLDDGSGRVCRLKKAIYGLKQAPRAWYHKLEEALLAGGFKKSECDPSLFLLQEKDEILMLLVYVNDILLFSASTALLDSAEQMLEMQFKCSKMGEVKYYLGMHVERDVEKGVLRLHQRKYCEGLAEKYGLQDGGKPATPLPLGFTVEPSATAAVAKATAGGDATAPTDGVLEAVKKVQKQQTHGEVLAGVDASAAWAKASPRSGEADWETWHERLCHVNFPMLQKLVKDGSLKGLEVKGGVKEIGSCPTCLETKFSKFPFNSTTGPAKTPLALVHMDVVGPTRAPSLSGSRYFLTIVDDHTRAVWVYPLKSKGEVAAAVLKEWMPRAQRECGHKDHKGWLLWDLTTQKLTVSRDVKFLESLYYKEWKQQQQKLPSTPLIVEADEVQQPSRQVEVAVSEEEMSGQTKGKDYDEVFAPVGKGTTLRVLLAIAALLGWKIRQMDIVTAFLNGIIMEEVYMKQPEGLDDGSGRVCRLKKAIYGLKQAPRAWYHKLEEALLAGGFKKSECDPSLFLLQEKDEILMLLVKKQNEVGLSSCETEYMALHHWVKEVVWLRRLLEELGVGQEEPTVVFCNNESAVKLAKNACLHGLTKVIRPKWHWVRRILDKEVRLEIVKTHQQAADIFTKRLAEADHWKGMKLAGMSVH
ncbi:hypothetical protein CLOP_g21318 [Closterium sp. NIES-67]|nr:hypothetical protein CLOP_g21318 [Closterium sp. NIES-67]